MKASWKQCLAASAASMALLFAADGVLAQARAFNVPAQPISQAITELARQAGVQISAPTSHLSDFRTRPVSGTMDVAEAVDRLIEGTDLEVVSRQGSTIVLRQRPMQGDATQVDEVVVVGSRIKGTRINEALPVTVLGAQEIDAAGAVDGDDLFRSISQAGDVNFNDADTDNGGINNARGDVASIDLRGLGTGNTLTLLNGRRLVNHPGTQVENYVPVTTVNTNAIPVMGVQRVEVLADGAAALFGTDAVAGVVNTVLKSNFNGFNTQAGMGRDEGGMEEYSFSFQAGKDFNDGRTNISIMGDYLTRDALFIWERPYATVEGRKARFGDGFSGLDYVTYSAVSAWAEGLRLNPTTYALDKTAAMVNGQRLTSTTGVFHVQPTANPGCVTGGFRDGVCFDDGTLAVTGADENLRYDLDTMRTISSAVDRANLFTFINHRFDNGIEAFGEIGYYWANTWSQRQQDTPLDYQRVLMSPTAYWNPLGAIGVTARLPGLTSVPTTGAAVQVQDFRFADLGYRQVDVENVSTRFVGGLRGEWRGFDWETGLLYSMARTEDVMDAVSMTGLQAAINRTTKDAYNPFAGGDLNSPKDGDFTVNSRETIDSFMVKATRTSETELMQWDFHVSRPDLYQLPAGDIGLAAGVEARRETFTETRDDRLNGTINFTDLTGQTFQSDIMGVTFTPDSSGARNVYSAFAELAVPIVSPEMNVPFVKAIDMQLAGRVEHYSLFGSVGAPKIALSYRPTDWLMFRGAWSKGFRAPNLMQLHQPDFERSNARRDYASCAVQLAIGAITSITQNNDYCASDSRVERRAGNLELKPEHSRNLTFGAVLEPKLWDAKYGVLTATVDYWKINQTDLVGIFGATNQLIMDYYLRQKGGYNENVVRADPTAEQIADAQQAGLAPVGDIVSINDVYLNLQPRESEGIDYRLHYSLRDTALGDFTWTLNASQWLKMYQEANADYQMLLDGLRDGVIAGVSVGGVEELVRRNGRPEWKVTSTVTWSAGPWTTGFYSSYVSDYYDTSATYAATGDYLVVDDWLTHNLYVQYEFEKGPMSGTRLRVGARNITNEDPPLANQRYGYDGRLHSNRGRWWYATIRKSF
ncbi:iron complex outermembrane receptor protein [Brevundimonas faecalis]|uniref:Iron complex outermembrane receptor protein n=2 Tax=Brevundimonas faecalis TaxID=947378 RepID=A0ABV2R6C7_9CAUL